MKRTWESCCGNEASTRVRSYSLSFSCPLLLTQSTQTDLMLHLVGLELAKMHIADIIHGDLTTSNMMVRLLTEEQRQPGKGRGNEVFEVVRRILLSLLFFPLLTLPLLPPSNLSPHLLRPVDTPCTGPHRLRPLLRLPLLRRARRRPLCPRARLCLDSPRPSRRTTTLRAGARGVQGGDFGGGEDEEGEEGELGGDGEAVGGCEDEGEEEEYGWIEGGNERY